MVTVLYFAGLKEKVGVDQEKLPFGGKTVRALVDFMGEKYEGFPKDTPLIAVNEEYVQLEEELQEGDVVAFIPPVSGG